MYYDQGASSLHINLANDWGDTALHLAARWGFGKYIFYFSFSFFAFLSFFLIFKLF